MHFRKMHGLGNDFVILDARKVDLNLSSERITRIADRHFGVGCDTVVVLENSDKADIFQYVFHKTLPFSKKDRVAFWGNLTPSPLCSGVKHSSRRQK